MVGNNKATIGQTEGKVWWLIFNKIFQQTNQKLANNNDKKIPTSQIPQEGKKNLLPDCPIQPTPTNQPTERTNRETLIKFQKSINQSCFHLSIFCFIWRNFLPEKLDKMKLYLGSIFPREFD
jgi:hypothetical protein